MKSWGAKGKTGGLSQPGGRAKMPSRKVARNQCDGEEKVADEEEEEGPTVMEQDPTYEPPDEEEEEVDEEDDGDGHGELIKTRNRAKRPWSNECMNANEDGIVEISRLGFPVDHEVTEESVRVVLGTKVSQMTHLQIETTIDWYKQLKVQAGNYFKDRAVEDLLYNATQLGVPFKNVEAIKTRWKECQTEEELETMGSAITRMKKEFRFGKVNGVEWKIRVEAEFMAEYKLAYLRNEFGKKVLGCIARQATRSQNDLGRRLNCVGQTKHKCIISKRAPNRKVDTKRSREVVGDKFCPAFVRPSDSKTDSKNASKVAGRSETKKKLKKVSLLCVLCVCNVVALCDSH
jgi:hypothetical protein